MTLTSEVPWFPGGYRARLTQEEITCGQVEKEGADNWPNPRPWRGNSEPFRIAPRLTRVTSAVNRDPISFQACVTGTNIYGANFAEDGQAEICSRPRRRPSSANTASNAEFNGQQTFSETEYLPHQNHPARRPRTSFRPSSSTGLAHTRSLGRPRSAGCLHRPDACDSGADMFLQLAERNREARMKLNMGHGALKQTSIASSPSRVNQTDVAHSLSRVNPWDAAPIMSGVNHRDRDSSPPSVNNHISFFSNQAYTFNQAGLKPSAVACGVNPVITISLADDESCSSSEINMDLLEINPDSSKDALFQDILKGEQIDSKTPSDEVDLNQESSSLTASSQMEKLNIKSGIQNFNVHQSATQIETENFNFHQSATTSEVQKSSVSQSATKPGIQKSGVIQSATKPEIQNLSVSQSATKPEIQNFRISQSGTPSPVPVIKCIGKSANLNTKYRSLMPCKSSLQRRPMSGQVSSGSSMKTYIDSHRPQTAPDTRQDLQSLSAFRQHAYLPHYCHFVRSVTLKGRGGPADREEEADDGYITYSEPSPTGSGLTRRNLRMRSGGLVNSRSSSMNDLDIEPESQMTRLSAVRPTIRIPSPDLDPVESSRTKREEMDTIVQELATRATKNVVRVEVSSAKTRRQCPKKGRTPGARGKRRKGKKKRHHDGNHGDESAEGDATHAPDAQDTQFAANDPEAQTAVNLAVPDLPSVHFGQQGKQSKGNGKKANRTLIIAPVVMDKQSTKVSPTTPTYSFYEFGDLTSSEVKPSEEVEPVQAVTIPHYMNDRMVLSLQSSRFELPMDMKVLESLTPQDYLRNYCVVSPRRKLLYSNIFQQHRNKSGTIPGKKALCTALTGVLINSMTSDQAEQLCDLLDVDEQTAVDLDLFSAVAALAERILYPEFLTEDTWNRTELQKEMLECADFCGLDWKLRGVNISHQVKKILKSL